MSDTELVQECGQVGETLKQALSWVGDVENDGVVRQERSHLERQLRRAAFEVGLLAKAAERPMCVGVFGPSQAGKSYLVSVLARRGHTLTAVFDGDRPELDFLSDLNPSGGNESTGLVTRFTIHKVATPQGFPVHLRLLTQTDVVKILCNIYYNDADLEQEPVPTSDEIVSYIAQMEAKAQADFVDSLREEHIWDLEEYFFKYLRKLGAHPKAFDVAWDRLARLAPRLPLDQRVELYSVMWGRHAELTRTCLRLLEALQRLDFAEEAVCVIEALVPRYRGTLNVETLSGLAHPKAETLKIKTKKGSPIQLPRPVVTALAAELRIVSKEKPWDFFDHADVLDFPGYRNRAKQHFAAFLGTPTAMK